jgi:SAM-dependent methyltransferase
MSASRSPTFDPHYLRYLADLGSTNLHAAASVATERLRSALALEPGESVLEIGCGTGNTILKFALESRVHVDGVDFLEEMLRVARVRLRLAGLRNGLVRADAALALPFRNESYDAVFTESVSRLVTLAFRLKAIFNPRLAGLRRHCQKLLEKHRDDHHHIETNLFVAIKT